MTPDTLAPSEKHMEDWIVANPGCLKHFTGTPEIGRPELNFLMGRQVPCTRGYIDLLYYGDKLPTPVELKVGELTADHLVQLLAYVGDIDFIMKIMSCEVNKHVNIPNTDGILIGHSVENDQLLWAAAGSHVSVLLYEFDGSSYKFRQVYANYLEHHQRRTEKLIDLLHNWNPEGLAEE